MNTLELQFNDQLTGGFKQKDLNVDPKLPYPDNSFDVVTCVVSIDYLIEPIKVIPCPNEKISFLTKIGALL